MGRLFLRGSRRDHIVSTGASKSSPQCGPSTIANANGMTDASSHTVASGVLDVLTTVDAAAARSPLLGAFVHPVVFDEKVNEHAEIRGHDDKDDP